MHGRGPLRVLLTSRSPSARVAMGALMSALCWLFIAASGVLPTGRIFVLTLASFVILVACHELGLGGACLVYLVSSVLSFLWPGLFIAVIFASSFGALPLLIVWLRGKMKPWAARLIVHALMSILMLSLLWGVGVGVLLRIKWEISGTILIGILFLLLQIFLVIYSYALQMFERLYLERIAPWLHRRT